MRKVLIEARPERRTLVTVTAAAGVKFKQAELDLQMPKSSMRDAVKTMVIDVEAFLGYSPWKKIAPAYDGWYETRGLPPFPAPGHIERLWFEADPGVDGIGGWKEAPDSAMLVSFTRAFEQGLEWRGLAAPWPWGYRDPVPPGCKPYRAQLVL